jgi:hypothetical protein
MNCGTNLRISEWKVNFREMARLSYQLISQVSIIAFCIDLSGLLSWTVEARQMLTCSGDSLIRLHQTTLGRRLGAGLFTHIFNQYPLPMNVPCGIGELTRLAADQRSTVSVQSGGCETDRILAHSIVQVYRLAIVGFCFLGLKIRDIIDPPQGW